MSKISFICNICNTDVDCELDNFGREANSCSSCGSSVRLRAVIYLLTKVMLNRECALVETTDSKSITGIGLSDWYKYAELLSEKFSYCNTFLHQEPFLDIANVSDEWFDSCDFIISSDVFEHVPPPVSRAFINSYRMLSAGGWLILTVPFVLDGKTQEWFPNLFKYKIVEIDSERVLVNKTKENKVELHRDLCFHGGEGDTLEMRIFSFSDLRQEIEKAGFDEIKVFDTAVPKYGIFWENSWSLPIACRKKIMPEKEQFISPMRKRLMDQTFAYANLGDTIQIISQY